MWCEYMRNPSRLFSNMRIPIAQCRWCLFKNLCLENEKNPVIRHLVLDEEIKDDVFEDEQDVVSKILEIMKSNLNKIWFKEKTGETQVEVYYDNQLLYKIPKVTYQKILEEWNEGNPNSRWKSFNH